MACGSLAHEGEMPMGALPLGIEDWLAAHYGATIEPPPGRSSRGPASDAEVAESPPGSAIDLMGLTVHLTYVDAKGETSERTVQCRKAWVAAGSAYVGGVCALRGAYRSFRIDRIIEIADFTSGELIAPEVFFEHIGLYETEPATLAFMKEVRLGLIVLMAIARSDGRLYSEEIEVALRWADHLADIRGIDMDDATLRRVDLLARNCRPDVETARMAFVAVGASGEESRLLARYVRQMIDADGIVASEEIEMIEALTAARTVGMTS